MSAKVRLRMTARVESASTSRNAAESSAPGERDARAGLGEGADLQGFTRGRAGAVTPAGIPCRARSRCARGCLGVSSLRAQARDEDVHGVRHRLLALAPGLLEDLLARDDGAGLAQQRLEDRELARRQLQDLVALPGRALGRIEAHVAARELDGGPALVAPQERLRARREHLEVEGLAEIVVGALGQSLDGRLGVVERRQHEDRLGESCLAGPAADLEPLAVGEPPVEHEQVVRVQVHQLLGRLDASPPRRRRGPRASACARRGSAGARRLPGSGPARERILASAARFALRP